MWMAAAHVPSWMRQTSGMTDRRTSVAPLASVHDRTVASAKTRSRGARLRTAWMLVLTCLALRPLPAQGVVRLPMTCSRGPGDQWFQATVSMPPTSTQGSTITVRIDSNPSGRVSHLGLHFLHGMRTDYRISAGAQLVDGSLRLVPGTGTPNVTASARLWRDGSGVHLLLPAQVANGASFTPPSVTFDLRVDATSPAQVFVEFTHYEVMADVVILGDIRTTCDPRSRPAMIGATRVVP